MATGIDKYINDILTKIYANQDLCKLLYYDDRNPLSQSDLADTSVLKTDKLNQRIYITPFSFETTDKTKSTLHIIVNNFELDENTKYFNDLEIDFVICINVRLWEIFDGSDETKTRLSLIVDELLNTFNRQQSKGIGKNHFQFGKIQKFNDWFWGMYLSFRLMEMPTYIQS